MEYLYPNLTSDRRNSDNLDNSYHHIRPTHLGSLVAYACLTCLACYFPCLGVLVVDARLRRIADAREPEGVQKLGTRDTVIEQGYNRQ